MRNYKAPGGTFCVFVGLVLLAASSANLAEVRIVYDAGSQVLPDDESLGLGFWSAGTGSSGFELKPEVAFVTTDSETEDARGGGGRYYRRQFMAEEFNDGTDLRVAFTVKVEHSVGSLAATCVQMTTDAGRTFGVGFVRDLACQPSDRVVLYAEDGQALDVFHGYNTDWLWRVKELGRYEMAVDVKRGYVLELIRNGAGIEDDVVLLSVEGAVKEPIQVKLSELAKRVAVPGIVFGHPVIHGGGQAWWYRLEITTSGESTAALPRRIGGKRQLFVDDWMIEKAVNVTRPLERPVKFEENPVLRCDKPWDVMRCDLYGSAVYDPKDKKIKLYYSAVTDPRHDDRLAVAESTDGGRTWVKPEYDAVAFGDYAKTNLVFEPACRFLAGPCVFIDEHDPAWRYKLFTSDYGDRDDGRECEKGMYVNRSADGVHWERGDYRRIDPLVSDTAQCAFWDERIDKYVGYVRFKPKAYGRAVGRMESRDFVNWSPPELVFVTKEEEFYSMGVTAYEGMYVGTPWVLWRKGDKDKHDPVISPGFAVSRDGFSWRLLTEVKRFEDEYISTGPAGSIDDRQIRMSSSLVVLEDEILFLYGVSADPHVSEMKVDVGLATLRLDGFRPVVAGDAQGELVTRPFVVDGGRLVINAACEAGGYVKVEVLGEDGKVVSGFDVDSVDAFTGDAIRHEMSWTSGSTFGKLKGQTVQLRFIMNKSKLYSFGVK